MEGVTVLLQAYSVHVRASVAMLWLSESAAQLAAACQLKVLLCHALVREVLQLQLRMRLPGVNPTNPTGFRLSLDPFAADPELLSWLAWLSTTGTGLITRQVDSRVSAASAYVTLERFHACSTCVCVPVS